MRSLLRKLFGGTKSVSIDETENTFTERFYIRSIPWEQAFELIFNNDEITPFEFVMDILEGEFQMTRFEAFEIAKKIHTEGRAGIGRMEFELAEKMLERINVLNEENGQALRVVIERWAGIKKRSDESI